MGAGHVVNNVKNVSPEAACGALVAPRAELRKPVATNRLGFALAGPGHLWKQRVPQNGSGVSRNRYGPENGSGGGHCVGGCLRFKCQQSMPMDAIMMPTAYCLWPSVACAASELGRAVVERRFGILDLSERRRLPGQPVCVRFLLEGGPIGLSRLSGYMQFAEKEWRIFIT